jgi:hypothetical protein
VYIFPKTTSTINNLLDLIKKNYSNENERNNNLNKIIEAASEIDRRLTNDYFKIKKKKGVDKVLFYLFTFSSSTFTTFKKEKK